MPGAKLVIPENPTFRDLDCAFVKGRNWTRKIGHETWINNPLGLFIDVRLFGHVIAKFYDNGTMAIYDGGHRTATTKFRLNHLIPKGYAIFQEKEVWYLFDYRNGWDNVKNDRVPFFDGMWFKNGEYVGTVRDT